MSEEKVGVCLKALEGQKYFEDDIIGDKCYVCDSILKRRPHTKADQYICVECFFKINEGIPLGPVTVTKEHLTDLAEFLEREKRGDFDKEEQEH